MVNNGTNPDPTHPFADAAADLTLISFGAGNCYEGNIYSTFYTLFTGDPPPCN